VFRAGPFRKNAAIRVSRMRCSPANGVVAAHDAVQAGTLSEEHAAPRDGGELEHDPKFFSPRNHAGVDVGGSAAIHERILALRARGGAIALILRRPREILALSDRIAVLSKGASRPCCRARTHPGPNRSTDALMNILSPKAPDLILIVLSFGLS
jgi:hypothetical protein